MRNQLQLKKRRVILGAMHKKKERNPFLEKQRLLVIAPHPDDEVLGVGGTIAKVKAAGGKVFLLVFSAGDLKFYDGGRAVPKETRKKELAKIVRFLDIDGCDLIYDDTDLHLRLDRLPRRDLIAQIERESAVSIDKIKPTAIAIPAPSYNQDHTAVFEAAFTAVRPHVRRFKPFQDLVLVYENPTLSWNVRKPIFRPNFYVDISRYLDTKKKALALHGSQKREKTHQCSLENVIDLARVRGKEASVEAAEAFMCYRFVT
ncbi:MAG: PIG-L family deacetylase [Candidatus Omnitrophica bacterium]|nr:PIG-L family deacetylase [Candidatus Omnitrophota bacterium]